MPPPAPTIADAPTPITNNRTQSSPPTYADVTGQHLAATKRQQRRQAATKSQPEAQRTTKTKQRRKTPEVPRRSRHTPKPSLCAHESAHQATTDPLDALDSHPHERYDTLQYLCNHGTAINPDTGQVADLQELLRCSDGALWSAANDEEVGRMCTGLGPDSPVPTGTETLEFIDIKDIPQGQKATFVRIVCADRPEKPQPRRVRWTLGGDKITYLGNKTTKTADLITAKLLLNSALSHY